MENVLQIHHAFEKICENLDDEGIYHLRLAYENTGDDLNEGTD